MKRWGSVAVPCHILVRQRDDCCAGMLTGVGIALGIAVMLFSFGLGVFYLFVARIEQLKKRAKNNNCDTQSSFCVGKVKQYL